MTNAEIAEIVARAEAATPGPWHYATDGETDKIADQRGSLALFMQTYLRGRRTSEEVMANAEFVAAARSDVPRLVAALRRAREALRGLLMICGEAHSESVYNALEEIKRARACLPDEDASWQQKGDRAALEEPTNG